MAECLARRRDVFLPCPLHPFTCGDVSARIFALRMNSTQAATTRLFSMHFTR
jgi:hypothetical protein